MTAAPELSVLLPVHNGEEHLREAVESILAQSYSDFELIVIDDHSTDESAAIAAHYAARDRRLRIVSLEENVGIANALNAGIASASAPLIARMDADDVAYPGRFAVQIREMHDDPKCGVLGTQIRFVDEAGDPDPQFEWVLPRTHNETVWRLLYGTPLCHPSVVMRADVVRSLEGYDPSFVNEDMELWTRMAFVTRMRNVDEVLFDYRMPARVHARKLAAWEPHIRHVSRIFIERIVGCPVAQQVVDALHARTPRGRDEDDPAVLDLLAVPSLLRAVFEGMTQLNMVELDEPDVIESWLAADSQERVIAIHSGP